MKYETSLQVLLNSISSCFSSDSNTKQNILTYSDSLARHGLVCKLFNNDKNEHVCMIYREIVPNIEIFACSEFTKAVPLKMFDNAIFDTKFGKLLYCTIPFIFRCPIPFCNFIEHMNTNKYISSLSINHVVTIPQGIPLFIYFANDKWNISTSKHIDIEKAIIANVTVSSRLEKVMKSIGLILDTFLTSLDTNYCYEYILTDDTLLVPDATEKKDRLLPIAKRNMNTMELTYIFEKDCIVASYSVGNTSLATIIPTITEILKSREDMMDVWLIPQNRYESILSFCRDEYTELLGILRKPIIEFTVDEYIRNAYFCHDQNLCMYLLSFVASSNFHATNYNNSILEYAKGIVQQARENKNQTRGKLSTRRLISATKVKLFHFKTTDPDLKGVKKMLIRHPWIQDEIFHHKIT